MAFLKIAFLINSINGFCVVWNEILYVWMKVAECAELLFFYFLYAVLFEKVFPFKGERRKSAHFTQLETKHWKAIVKQRVVQNRNKSNG